MLIINFLAQGRHIVLGWFQIFTIFLSNPAYNQNFGFWRMDDHCFFVPKIQFSLNALDLLMLQKVPRYIRYSRTENLAQGRPLICSVFIHKFSQTRSEVCLKENWDIFGINIQKKWKFYKECRPCVRFFENISRKYG